MSDSDWIILVVIILGLSLCWLIYYLVKQNEKKKERRKIKTKIKWKYQDIKLDDTFLSVRNKLGRDYSVEKEMKENDKLIKVLKWYVFEYCDSETRGAVVGTTNLGNGNIGTTIGGASSSTIKKPL